MKKDISIILFLILAATAMAQTADDSDSIRQYTNWSIVAGPNICGYRHNLSNTDDAPDRITPSVGADAGTAISYHITTKWQLRLTVLACLERAQLVKDDETSHLNTLGGDLALQAGYKLIIQNSNFQILCGPYTHFITASNSSNPGIANPYSRIIATNPRTDNPIFAMGDFNAGLALTMTYQPFARWQLELDFKWGITDLLNADSHKLFVKPYKLAIHLAHTF